jgi:hypothetical protein
VSAKFRKAKGSFAQAARSVFDHDRIAATKRIRRILGYGTGLEHEDIAFHQWKIEMFRVRRAIVSIAIDLASNLRTVFADGSLLPRTNAVTSSDRGNTTATSVATDVSQITSVGLKLIRVALIGKTDNCVDLVSAHKLADARPAALALGMAEFCSPKPRSPLLIIFVPMKQIVYT